MKYLKSAFAGIVASALVCIVIPALIGAAHLFVFILVEAWKGLRAGGFGISLGSAHWHLHSPTLQEWLLVLSSFGLGFLWELRRLERRELTASVHGSGEGGS